MKLEAKKLESGYWIVVNQSGESLKRRATYCSMLFEYKRNANQVISSLKTSGLPKDLTF